MANHHANLHWAVFLHKVCCAFIYQFSISEQNYIWLFLHFQWMRMYGILAEHHTVPSRFRVGFTKRPYNSHSRKSYICTIFRSHPVFRNMASSRYDR